MHRHAAVEGELGHPRSFAPLFDQVGLPPVHRDSHCELINPLGSGFSRHQACLAWPAATPRPGGHSRRWPLQPNLDVVGHFGNIPPLHGGDTVQKQCLNV